MIYLLHMYGKNEVSGLTPNQKKQLRDIVTQIKAAGASPEKR
jgi:hypothetical protein